MDDDFQQRLDELQRIIDREFDEFIESSYDYYNRFTSESNSLYNDDEFSNVDLNVVDKTNPRLKISRYHELTCCICYESDLKTVMKLDDTYLKLNDIDPSKLFNGITDEFIFLGGCEKHSTCVKCLKRLALDFNNHTINERQPYIKCEHIDICINEYGFYTYYEHSQIKKILSTQEYERYINYAENYEFPGFKKIKCPVCDTKNILSTDEIRDTRRGELIVECYQKCYSKFCFHCNKTLGFFDDFCSSCYNSNIMTDPNRYNHYFYKKPCDRIYFHDILYRNYELTNDIILEQIKEIVIDNHDATIHCPVCLVNMYKTELCNTIEHCNVEICYSCGKIGDIDDGFSLGDHWSERGIKGCPRWDNSPLWNNLENCNFLCSKYCYGNEIGDCAIEIHQEGIENMKECRKKMQVYHKLKSLLKNKRNEIYNIMDADVFLRLYLPPKNVFNIIEHDMSLFTNFSYNSFI